MIGCIWVFNCHLIISCIGDSEARVYWDTPLFQLPKISRENFREPIFTCRRYVKIRRLDKSEGRSQDAVSEMTVMQEVSGSIINACNLTVFVVRILATSKTAVDLHE